MRTWQLQVTVAAVATVVDPTAVVVFSAACVAVDAKVAVAVATLSRSAVNHRPASHNVVNLLLAVEMAEK